MPFLVEDMAVLGTALSANMLETDEKFLVCRNVPVARTGIQMYLGSELGINNAPGQAFKVYRLPDDVFDVATLRSLESKPVTNNHPPGGVDIYNSGTYIVGHVRNVRRDGDHIVADLVITDAHLIETIKGGHKREVSAGYTCEYEPYKDGFKQTNIRINHIAVVTKGRAGPTVAIKDEHPNVKSNRKGAITPMNEQALKAALLSKFAQDAAPEDVMQAAQLLMLDAAPSPEKPAAKEDNQGMFALLASLIGKKQTADADESEKKEDLEEVKKEVSDMKATLDALAARFLKDEDGDAEEKKETEDDEPDMTFAEVVADEDEDAEETEAEKKAAQDAAYKQLMADLKPHVAKLPPKAQKAFADAFKQIKPGKNAYAGIQKAKTSHARKTADADTVRNLGKEWAEKYNPHYQKKA